jgi:hypothetical protein
MTLRSQQRALATWQGAELAVLTLMDGCPAVCDLACVALVTTTVGLLPLTLMLPQLECLQLPDRLPA